MSELPKGWQKSPLDKIVPHNAIISDGDWVESKDQDPSGSVRLIQLADIGDGGFRNKSQRFMNEEAASRLNCSFLEEGDLLVARMPDPLGRACLFPNVGQRAVTVVDVCFIRETALSALSNKLLQYWFNSPYIRGLISSNASGSTRKRITRKKLEKFEFPVPPLPEQKRIVEKLDEVLAQVDTIKARLDGIPELLKRFRQSVLASAVSGKLTESKQAWVTTSLSKVGKIVGGKTPSKSNLDFWDGGNIPWVSPKDMKSDVIEDSIDKITELSISEGGMKYIPKNSLLMVTRSGILSHTFPVAITAMNLTINQDIKALIPNENDLDNKFGLYLIKGLAPRILRECSKAGTTVASVETKLLETMEFGLPIIEEQKEIVRLVDQYFAFADTIEAQVKKAQARVDNLTQSILAKAFRGELVAQDPNDEPAELLLQRIAKARAEAEQLAKAAKKAGKKTA